MYAFIHIPKAAGSSLYSIIGGQSLSYLGHVRAIDAKFFAFTRNPYDRLVDAYVYLTNGGGQTELDLLYQDILNRYIDFTDFVLHIEQDELTDKIVHIKPMTWFLCDNDNRIVVQNVFKIEEPDRIDIFMESNGYGKLSDVRINVTERPHYSAYLNPENIEEINRLYNMDFNLFKYEKL